MIFLTHYWLAPRELEQINPHAPEDFSLVILKFERARGLKNKKKKEKKRKERRGGEREGGRKHFSKC